MKVSQISLAISNAFLIQGRRPILVDAGCRSDWDALSGQVEARGVPIEKLAGVVLTHVHADHCGCAAELKKRGVPVIACAKSQSFLAEGIQEHGRIARFSNRLDRLIQKSGLLSFVPVEVDVAVESEVSLADFGIDGKVVRTPGHTESSLSVLLDNGIACIGDLLMGGVFGLPPAWIPALHPSSKDQAECRAQIINLRKIGYRTFCVGHGDILESRFIDEWILK
ncbi:MBL fold metallo-hydrolase [bacterium]|nr:MBL fold metallo-hydrolase [bacterium]